jgi:pyridoxal phosphate enzyme (YggS family)
MDSTFTSSSQRKTVTTIEEIIAANYHGVRRRIDAACRRAGRDPAAVTLVAVTKYARLEWVRCLVGLGVVELGESRPQQLVQRAQELNVPVNWHLIGNLQRNKVRSVLPYLTMLHAADSLRLLEAVDRIARELDLRPRVLVEVNLSGEEAKHGFQADELLSAWDHVAKLSRIQVEGLMPMAAYSPDPENARPAFARLRGLQDELRARSDEKLKLQLQHLSMGMTGDFEVAIEEGATIVRIGSALWEGLS